MKIPQRVLADPEISALATLRNSKVCVITAYCFTDQQESGKLLPPTIFLPEPSTKKELNQLILFHEHRSNPHFQLIHYSDEVWAQIQKVVTTPELHHTCFWEAIYNHPPSLLTPPQTPPFQPPPTFHTLTHPQPQTPSEKDTSALTSPPKTTPDNTHETTKQQRLGYSVPNSPSPPLTTEGSSRPLSSPPPSLTTPAPVQKQFNPTILFSYSNKQYSALSNLYLSPVTIRGQIYRSVEHFFQSRKFLPHDKQAAQAILDAPTAFEAKARGRNPKFQIRPNWDSLRIGFMREAIRHKFTPEGQPRKTLLATHKSILIEDTKDKFWGKGNDSSGANKMGELLMNFRDQLQQQPTLETHIPEITQPDRDQRYSHNFTTFNPVPREQQTPVSQDSLKHQPKKQRHETNHDINLLDKNAAPFSCAPLALTLASLILDNEVFDFSSPSQNPFTLMTHARTSTKHLNLPRSGSTITAQLDILPLQPALFIENVWPYAPQEPFPTSLPSSTHKVFIVCYKKKTLPVGHAVLVCASFHLSYSNFGSIIQR